MCSLSTKTNRHRLFSCSLAYVRFYASRVTEFTVRAVAVDLATQGMTLKIQSVFEARRRVLRDDANISDADGEKGDGTVERRAGKNQMSSASRERF